MRYLGIRGPSQVPASAPDTEPSAKAPPMSPSPDGWCSRVCTQTGMNTESSATSSRLATATISAMPAITRSALMNRMPSPSRDR